MAHEDIWASIDRAIAAVKSERLLRAYHQKKYPYECGHLRIDPPLSLEEQKELQQLSKRLDDRYRRLESQAIQRMQAHYRN